MRPVPPGDAAPRGDHKRYNSLGFTLLAVNVEKNNAEGARKWLQETPVTFPVLFDPEIKSAKLYKVQTMPSTVIIGRDGTMRFMHNGYKAGDERRISEPGSGAAEGVDLDSIETSLLARLLALAAAGLAVGGCSIEPWVKPYERDGMADPIMSFDRDPVSSAYTGTRVRSARRRARRHGRWRRRLRLQLRST